MKSRSTILVLLATAASATLLMSAPAEAGRKTGSWKYSPEAIYDYQAQQEDAARRARWERRHAPPGYGYGYRAGPRYRSWDDDY